MLLQHDLLVLAQQLLSLLHTDPGLLNMHHQVKIKQGVVVSDNKPRAGRREKRQRNNIYEKYLPLRVMFTCLAVIRQAKMFPELEIHVRGNS